MSLAVAPSGPETGHQGGERPLLRRAVQNAFPFVAVAVMARLLTLRLPLTPDEGGYLLAASQWHHGTSTYGAYFVDRPPLLMAIYALADLLGGASALRVIGTIAAAAAILAACRIGGRVAAAVVAVFLITPRFGTTNVDGELLALPLVLGGLYGLLVAFSSSGRHAARAAAAGGALAMAAFLVKQDMVDAFVAALAAAAVFAVNGRGRWAMRRLAPFGAAALAIGAMAVALAWLRGTSPTRLWDALVTFRLQAGAVISAQGDAAGGTSERLHSMLQALAVSGAPLVALAALLAAGRPNVRPDPDRPWGLDLRWVAMPVLGWESAAALLGGSYWLHYLIALIPGLVLLVTAVPVCRSVLWPRRLVMAALVVAGISTGVAFAERMVHREAADNDALVSAYLASHRSQGDTVVVGFGHPNIVYDAGMGSPYEHLWSLSARVRDPRLTELTTIMNGPLAPRWIVVAGSSLGTWGIDATAADQALRRSYRLVTTAGDWEVFERQQPVTRSRRRAAP